MNTKPPFILGPRTAPASTRLIGERLDQVPNAPDAAAPAIPLETAAQAHARGLAEGSARERERMAESERERRQQHEDARARITRQHVALDAAIDGLRALRGDYAMALEDSLARLTALACTRLLLNLAEEGALAASVTRAIALQYGDQSPLRLALSAADLANLPAELIAVTGAFADESLGSGQFRVVRAGETIDLDIERQLRRLHEALGHDGDTR